MRIFLSQWFARLALLAAMVSIGACSSSPKNHSLQNNNSQGKAESVVRVAESMLGRPYKYGGVSPSSGFDCSGLVYYSHRRHGISLPRTSYAQYKASHPIPRNNLRRGDLLFFRISGKISHVGIYLGKNRFIHAPSSGKRVSIARLNSRYWSRRFIRGGRIGL
ncbi:MAG: C40 family peptidase [Thioalkalispiraceae bacterium]|jgi:cell wall-associated NlpC family hydrolase